ncbi:hypothetical protein [Kitasatospora sp. GP82]|uniref:hypothetical protein n=1 Tax=Kitasatospora sp. GP82 TaxID=3035089 RepID=UPI0024752219|nr:hypothetical protein [Kitasatospora sp. GP82]MDH6129611.1 hypothetical protein [Kitasatospora sp. GP82]
MSVGNSVTGGVFNGMLIQSGGNIGELTIGGASAVAHQAEPASGIDQREEWARIYRRALAIATREGGAADLATWAEDQGLTIKHI